MHGQTAVVTGSRSGVGLAIRGELESTRCHVLVVDLPGEGAESPNPDPPRPPRRSQPALIVHPDLFADLPAAGWARTAPDV